MLPGDDTQEHYVDAEGILRERAYTEEQISRLAGELGKDLKLVAASEERQPESREQIFGHDQKRVGLYHRVKDASLIEAVLSSFKRRTLYTRVMEGQPDPVRARREGYLDSNGRGRSRSERRRQ